jgi:hypothetical protein
VSSNDLDFVFSTDPDALIAVQYMTLEANKEMPGNGDDLFASAFIFEATFTTNSSVEIWAHAINFGAEFQAEPFVNDLASAMGKLPALFRDTLNHVVLNVDDQTACAEELAGFFVAYSNNIQTRVENNDLEETVFHETIHVALETDHAQSACWLQAQQDDPDFITEYAASRPLKEDLSESALFVYTLVNHPG